MTPDEHAAKAEQCLVWAETTRQGDRFEHTSALAQMATAHALLANRPLPVELVATEEQADEPFLRGTITDVGGAYVEILVDIDTPDYPEPGAYVELRVTEAPSPEHFGGAVTDDEAQEPGVCSRCDRGYETPGCGAAWHPLEPAPSTEGDAEPSPDDWHCPRCGSTRWVSASLTGPVCFGGRAIRQCVPCGYYSNDPTPEQMRREAEPVPSDEGSLGG